MPLTLIRESPKEESYTPLAAFQAETPESFSTPVLHHRQIDSKVLISSDQVSLIPIFGDKSTSRNEPVEQIMLEGIDLWVTNENLIFFNKPLSVGAAIPYLSLTLHAIQRVDNETGLYMQISLTPDISSTSNTDDHDEDELLELTLIPKASGETSQTDVANAVFEALSTCTSLHSAASNTDSEGEDDDRILFEGDGEESRLDGFPGEGGWITAENIDQFRFEDVEIPAGMTILGPGAGNVRPREEDDDVATDDAAGPEDTKWRRTD
ncbi:regulator of volume decrease after cellular swelling-domain-containing protein [Sphaerosporella brunnea]|uniref:Regulator of volume decrease after cellular swelling-domain-containing protein n=1 Tax=Sphaerosporella brunnea TaxID=1250544 RepID=A0A5J5F7H5_9PEZI|nr:regulator of volume decrease after cellular swelling-domain-containing protein [Sphaerosporella brunnea]